MLEGSPGTIDQPAQSSRRREAADPPRRTPARPGSPAPWLIPLAWVAILASSMPVLLDLGRHILANSWSWYALTFPALATIAIRRGPLTRPRPTWALALVLVGIANQGWAIASGELRNGRIGVLLTIVGLLLLQGRANSRPLLLLALCVPVPSLVLLRLEPFATPWIARGTAWGLRQLGAPALAYGNGGELSAQAIAFNESDLGIQTAILAAGLAWFVGLARRWSTIQLLVASAAAGVVGMTFHVLLTPLILLSVDAQNIEDARMVRDIAALVGPLAVFTLWLGMGRRPAIR